MKTLLTILAMAFSFIAIGQEKSKLTGQEKYWKIYHNGKLVVFAKHESKPNRHVYRLERKNLEKKDFLEVKFSEKSIDNTWERTVVLVDDAENELFRETGNEVQVPNSTLKKLLAGKKKVYIYSWALPKDPQKAATIRVARVLLGTIEIKF